MSDTEKVVQWAREHLELELTAWQQTVLKTVVEPGPYEWAHVISDQQERLAKLLWEAYCVEMDHGSMEKSGGMRGLQAGQPIYDEATLTEENDG